MRTPEGSLANLNIAPLAILATPMPLLFASLLSISAVFAAGPKLTETQIRDAIANGESYKTKNKFLEKGLPGTRVQLAGPMAKDGITKYVTFYNDYGAIAMEASFAHQQMRALTPDQVQSNGLLHAIVEVHGRGIIPTGKMNRRYREGRAHLVIKSGERVIQPAEKSILKESGQTVEGAIWGFPEEKLVLRFTFDIDPQDLEQPVQVILIDGDGNRHQHSANLKGVLEIQR